MYRFALAVPALLTSVGSAWAGPSDLFAEKVKDFGTTPRGPVLVHYFRFTNTTGQALTLGQPRPSCGLCTTVSLSKNQVAPGDSAAVVVYLDTRKIPTPNVVKSVTIYVPFHSPSFEEVLLRVQTVTRDDLIMSPDTLAFGTLKAGQGGTVSTKVTFASDPNWQITGVASTGGYVRAAQKLDAKAGGSVTYEITATLDKDCPAGNWVSDIYLTTSNAAVGRLRIPVTVNVTPAAPVTAATGEVVGP